MTALILMIFVFAGYIVMYRIYGKYISKRIFRLNKAHVAPSVEFQDGVDYQPTRKEIIFGHHFASIAGTGSIVGPAIAVIWGWVPAILWIFLGSIFIGAVHDFGVLIINIIWATFENQKILDKQNNTLLIVVNGLILLIAVWIIIEGILSFRKKIKHDTLK